MIRIEGNTKPKKQAVNKRGASKAAENPKTIV
jgi:hypothetical protein